MPEAPAKPPMMERIGLQFFRRLSERYPRNFSPDEVHVLNAGERKALKALQTGAVVRAAIAGGISAALGVVAGIILEPMLEGQVEDPPFELWWPYFTLVTGISILVTIFEIAFLYWDSLRTVHRLSAVAGLDLFPNQNDNASVAVSLVRAALELPNPPDDMEGVNPQREVSKFRLILGTIVYKLKATATNFILKAVVRRVVGRSGFRTLIEFVAVPVYAVWNALICWWVLRQARVRAMGPSAANEYMGFVLENEADLSPEVKGVIFQAVGAAVVRTVDVHPNLVAMMEVLEKRLGDPGDIVLDDSHLFLEGLKSCKESHQVLILQTLTLATLIDGSIGAREKQLLIDAYLIAGRSADLSKPRQLCKAFVRGDDITREMVQGCLPAKLPV